MKKITIIYFLTALFLIIPITISSENIQSINAAAFTDQYLPTATRDNYIGWRYKTINGTLYKRLYDYATNCWIGEWIPV